MKNLGNMKMVVKKLMMVVTSLLLVAGMSSCGAPKKTPTEVVGLYLDAAITQDFTELNKYTKLNESKEQMLAEMENELKSELGSAGLDEKEIIESLLAAMQKIKYTVVDEKIDGDTAEVTIEIQGLDFGKVLDNTMSKAMELAMSGEISEDQAESEVAKIMMAEFKQMQIVDTPKEMKVTLFKEKNHWLLSEEEIEKMMAEGLIDFTGVDDKGQE